MKMNSPIEKDLELILRIFAESAFGMMIFTRQPKEQTYRAVYASDSIFQSLALNQDILGQSLYEIIKSLIPESKVASVFNRLKTIKSTVHFEFELVNDLKEKSWFELRFSRVESLRASDESYLVLLLSPIAERKTKEILVRRQIEDLQKAARLASLGEMAAGIAHELNTPLNTIQSYVDFIRMNALAENNRQNLDNSLDKIESTVQQISGIIVGLCGLTRSPNEEKYKVRNLNKVVTSVLPLLEIGIKNKAISLQIDYDDKANYLVRCSKAQISQVIVNLINNSVEAVVNSRAKWVRIKLRECGDEVSVQVLDGGKGIDPEMEAKVMTPFFTTKETGSGLGLTLAKNIITNHGGRIFVNHECENTCFEFRLPKIK